MKRFSAFGRPRCAARMNTFSAAVYCCRSNSISAILRYGVGREGFGRSPSGKPRPTLSACSACAGRCPGCSSARTRPTARAESAVATCTPSSSSNTGWMPRRIDEVSDGLQPLRVSLRIHALSARGTSGEELVVTHHAHGRHRVDVAKDPRCLIARHLRRTSAVRERRGPSARRRRARASASPRLAATWFPYAMKIPGLR